MTHNENPALPTDFDSLIQELHCRAGVLRQPVNGTFELTERCNLSCSMCYVRQASGDKIHRAKELTTIEWIELAHEAIDNGMVFLLLTGGEIFLRDDFFELYTPITRLGIFITLYTNGTLITDSIAAQLADSPPIRISISLYGATANTYKTITGVTESYSRLCRGIEALLKQDLTLELKAIITKKNVNEIDAMRKMAHNWGLPISVGFQLTKRRDGAISEVAECRLSASDCIELEVVYNNSVADWNKEINRKKSLSNDCIFNCNAGRAAFVISSQGVMNACVDLPLPAARPIEIGFDVAWKQVQNFVESAPPMSSICLTCNARPYCTICPAWSYLETGTLVDPVQYLCDIAHERKMRYK